MRTTGKALKAFVGSFNLPAYASMSVPRDVDLPYLTYPLVEPEWNQKASFYIQGWYKYTPDDVSYTEMMKKCDDIIKEIGTGIIVNTDNGYMVIYPETPLVQFITDVENGTKSFYINLSINSYHMPGE